MWRGTFLLPTATSVPPADLSSPAPTVTAEGTRTATTSPHPALPRRQAAPGGPGRGCREEGFAAALFLPLGTARDTVTARERDRHLAWGQGPCPPRCPPTAGCTEQLRSVTWKRVPAPQPAAPAQPSAVPAQPDSAGATASAPELPAQHSSCPIPSQTCDTHPCPTRAARPQAAARLVLCGQDGL